MHIEKTSDPKTLQLPAGFRAAGISAGIKKSGVKDMALIVSDVEAVMAGTFTTNQVCAAPVKLCRKHLEGRKGRAIIVNSGVANACTGPEGMKAAQDMAAQTASLLNVPETQVFVCSTGTIGKQLPMDVIGPGSSLSTHSKTGMKRIQTGYCMMQGTITWEGLTLSS